MTIGIYSIFCNKNEKRYIGSSVNIVQRFRQHLYALRHSMHHNPVLQNAWNKYGEDVFEFEEILECDEDALRVWEKRIIDTVEPEFNINGKDPESGLLRHSAETRMRMSIAQRNQPAERIAKRSESLKGKRNALGYKHTEDAKNRMSASKMGHVTTEATRLKMAMAKIGKRFHLGFKHSDESKAKMSANRKAKRLERLAKQGESDV